MFIKLNEFEVRSAIALTSSIKLSPTPFRRIFRKEKQKQVPRKDSQQRKYGVSAGSFETEKAFARKFSEQQGFEGKTTGCLEERWRRYSMPIPLVSGDVGYVEDAEVVTVDGTSQGRYRNVTIEETLHEVVESTFHDDVAEKLGERNTCTEESTAVDIIDANDVTCINKRYDDEESNTLINSTNLTDITANTNVDVTKERLENSRKTSERRNGTCSFPELRGCKLTPLEDVESGSTLDLSLNLLNISVDNKRQQNAYPSRLSKRLARKLVSHRGENMLQYAVTNRDYEMLEKILSSNKNGGFDINFLYPPGVSILHQACVFGDFEVVKLLIEKGADVKMKTWTDLSPTKLAALYGHFDVAQLLLLTGADVDDIKDGFQI